MNQKCSSLLVLLVAGTVFGVRSENTFGYQNSTAALPIRTNATNETSTVNSATKSADGEARKAVSDQVSEVNDLIRKDEFVQARDAIQKWDDENSVPFSARLMSKQSLLAKLLRADKSEEVNSVELAKSYLQSTVEHFSASQDATGPLVYFSQLVLMVIEKNSSADDANQYIQGVIEKLDSKLEQEPDGNIPLVVSGLTQALALNTSRKDIEAARAMLDNQVEKISALSKSHPENKNFPKAIQTLLRASLGMAPTEKQGEIVERLLALADDSLNQPLSAETSGKFVEAYMTVVSSKTRSNPKEAKELLERALEKLTELKTAENENFIKPALSMLNSNKSRIEASLLQQEMIGKPAPSIEAEHWINGEATSLEELKGKVVLLDFWAVWCGPCIMTFPELKHLKQEYADKGLVILGATRRYGYVWDEEGGRPTRPESQEPVTTEEELSMLKKFLDSHELTHPTFVTPENSQLMKNYGVTGIPHVALVDRSGNIALVQVGSGKESSERIEKKIVELLESTDTKEE